jgi:hypothetical protein
MVWVVWAQAQHIDVWRQDTLDRPTAALNVGDTLDGKDIVPGFSAPVAGIFADPLS